MNEARAIARCEEAAALLPPRFRRAALQMPDHRKRYTEEFRLRAGQPPAALLPEGEVTLPYFGADSRVTPRDLAQMVDAVTDYSRYACAETLRQGFLCLHGGFRARRMRNGGAAERRGRKPAGYFLALAAHRHRADRPGRADGRQPCSAREPSGARSCSRRRAAARRRFCATSSVRSRSEARTARRCASRWWTNAERSLSAPEERRRWHWGRTRTYSRSAPRRRASAWYCGQ